MKNSGIEWIGEIPDSWKLVNIGNVLKEHKQENKMLDTRALQFKYGTIVPKKELNLTQDALDILTKYNVVSPNIIMVNGLNLAFDFVTQRVALVKENGVITSTYIALAPQELIVPEYATYTLKAFDSQKVFHSLGRGLRCMLSYDVIKREKMPLPSLAVQRSIVNCLVQKLGEVDKLIEVQQAQIDKLKEYKQSVITEAVTKGLDPTVPMKDSGVEWIGYVNASYKIQNIRSIFTIRKEIIGKEPETVLSITQSGLKIKSIHENAGQMADSYSNYQIVHVGDFAMNHMDLLTGGIGISQFEGVTSPDYRVFELSQSNMCAKYFLYIFLAYYKNKIFYAFGQGAANLGRWRLPAQNFYSIYIPVPDGIEQQQIADYLDDKCAKIDKLIAIKQAKIDKLQEYKKSLIYEYVTGKKEIV